MPDLPAVKPREAIRALERAGFVARRQTGSHVYLNNPVTRKRSVVAMHNRDLTTGMLHAIIQQAGLTVDEFIELLRE